MEEAIDLQKEFSEDKINKKSMKKSFFTTSNLFTAAIILVVAFLPILLDAPSSQENPSRMTDGSPKATPSPSFAAKISFIEGQVEIWSGKANSWIPIELDKIIGGDTQIRTGKKSNAIIKLDNSELRLNENSHIIFKKVEANNYNGDLTSDTKDEEKINLQASYQPGAGVILYWSSKEKSPNGFFVLRSLSPNPIYPDCEFIYLPSPTIRSYVWPTNGDVGKYYFKICASGKNRECQEYSNEKEKDIR